MISDILSFTIGDISIFAISLRILLSFIAGFAMGMEREVHQHPAGLRTIIMITVSSTLLMILSMSLPGIAGTGDPARIAAQVVSGIGFLGGGAILRQGINIRGLTSAAIIWAAAAIGLTIGAGLYFAAGFALTVYVLTLLTIEKLKLIFIQAEHKKNIDLEYIDIIPKTEEIVKILKDYKIEILNTDIHYQIVENKTAFTFSINIPKSIKPEDLKERLSTLGTLTSLYLHE